MSAGIPRARARRASRFDQLRPLRRIHRIYAQERAKHAADGAAREAHAAMRSDPTHGGRRRRRDCDPLRAAQFSHIELLQGTGQVITEETAAKREQDSETQPHAPREQASARRLRPSY